MRPSGRSPAGLGADITGRSTRAATARRSMVVTSCTPRSKRLVETLRGVRPEACSGTQFVQCGFQAGDEAGQVVEGVRARDRGEGHLVAVRPDRDVEPDALQD